VPAITGIGLHTAIGDGAAQACAALRAGMSRVAESDRYAVAGADPADLEPLYAAPVPGVESGASGEERLLQLALPALGEAIASAGLTRAMLAQTRLVMSLPSAVRPGFGPLDQRFAANLVRATGLPDFGSIEILREGHSGAVHAIELALAYLSRHAESYAIVLAVDSVLDSPTLGWLDRRDRLKGSRNPEGIAVGEAGTALVIERTRHAEARGARLWATVDAVGRSRESATILGDVPCTGDGLTRALRAALAQLDAAPSPAWVLTDHNGERYRALEFGYVVNRVTEAFPELRHTWFTADGLGDTGAAVGGILAARVAHAFARGYAPSSRAWVLTGSDEGERGVLVLGTPRPGGK
jgi:3-oxoacyl-[acyl-carrier-protein] synthase-1